MNSSFGQFLTQAKNFYNGLSPSRRLSLLVVLALTLTTFGVLSYLATHEEQRNLVSNLPPEDIQAVATTLRAKNIPATVSAGGNAVSVPASRLDEARLELAAAGLPRGGAVGFEIFDREGITGLTSFREQVNYRRALEGELARTIRSLGEVRDTRVHIVIPAPTLFREDKRDPSASVVVNLNAGRVLSGRQIKGIRYLVSSAVEGLAPERVTIIDGQGTVLAKAQTADSGGMADDHLEYQKSVEGSLEHRILNLVEPLVGAGRVVAQVTATVDFQKSVETSESYDPDKTVVRSEQRSSEKRDDKGGQAAGVAGTASNLPPGSAGQTDSSGSNYLRNSETLNYEMDKKTLRTEYPQGALKRLSVAVVVDGSYLKEGEGTGAKTVFQPRTADEMTRYTNLIKSAVGFDAQRGDQVEVTNSQFQVQEIPKSDRFEFIKGIDLTSIFKQVGIAVFGLILLIMVIRPLTRAIYANSGRGESMLSRPTTLVEMERNMAQSLAAPNAPRQNEPVEAVKQLAQENPGRAAQVLRSWLEDSR